MFPEWRAVYPGHPVTVAYFIVKKYPSLDKALERCPGHTFCNALGDNDIPGAGSCVYRALYYLRRLRDGVWTLDDFFEHGQEDWRGETKDGYKKYRRPGQAQANMVKNELINLLETWDLGKAKNHESASY